MITDEQYRQQAEILGLSFAELKTIAIVESEGQGFYSPGVPKILFERHIFYRQLVKNCGQHFADTVRKTDPELCNPIQSKSYGKYSEQHPKLQRAVAIHRQSALEACSWGAGQVLGSNWKSLGYDNVQQLVNDAYSDIGQLRLMVRFLKANPAIILAARSHNWDEVARRYNGPGYRDNDYHTKLRDAYQELTA